MKTHILAGIIFSGILATPAAQAASPRFAEEIYSGMSAAAIQKDERANPAAERFSTASKAVCVWQEGKSGADSLYAAYPGDEYVEKAYLSPDNQRFVC